MVLLTPWKLIAGGVRDLLLALAAVGLAWALGELQRTGAARRAGERARIIDEERVRIARELHDVVAHTVSVIAVQAAAAEDVFDRRPDRAREALGTIQEAARSALTELRTLLHTLRPDPLPGEPADPQPGLAQLESLAAALGSTGLRVQLRWEGTQSSLPDGVELSAYRIVQESLTNTLRHARATRAEVLLRYADTALDLEVVDDGSAVPAARAVTGTGHGIVGMRERVRLLGGTLDAGPLPGGGFRVRAHLPVQVRC